VTTVASLIRGRKGDQHAGYIFEGRTYTWDEVVSESAVRASILNELLVADRPPHIGILLENTPDYLFWIGGAALIGACIGILVGYWALLTFVPVPGHGAGNYAEGANLANYVDKMYLPLRKHDGDHDPEGLLSTLPAIAIWTPASGRPACRQAQAIAGLKDIEGVQTHRSWWVARAAITGVVEDGRNLRLQLVGGLEAPVSRSRVGLLRQAGWLAGAVAD
jgi:hypothetical protein